jgi:hypothetical protein
MTNGDGAVGNPIIGLSTAGTAGTYHTVTTDAYGRVTAGVTTLVLDDLDDAIITTPTAGQTLSYNGTNWVNIGTTGGATGGGAAKRIWSGNIASTSGTTQFTPATAAPAVSQGTQLWSAVIDPWSVNAVYVIQSNVAVAASVNNANLTLALYRTVNGVTTFIGGTLQIVSSGTNSSTLSFSITDKPATTLPVTYQIRVGTNTGTWYVNRRTSEITYGGLQTGWVMWEY